MNSFCSQERCDGCPSRVVCHCLKVTEAEVVDKLINLGIRTLKDLRRTTGAGDGCTCCHDHLKGLIEQHSYAAVG